MCKPLVSIETELKIVYQFTPSHLGEFDPNIPEEGPTSPPPGWLDCVTGYEKPKGEGEADYPVICR